MPSGACGAKSPGHSCTTASCVCCRPPGPREVTPPLDTPHESGRRAAHRMAAARLGRVLSASGAPSVSGAALTRFAAKPLIANNENEPEDTRHCGFPHEGIQHKLL